MNRLLVLLSMFGCFTLFADSAKILDVTAAQRLYPRSGTVDITVMLSGSSNDAAKAVCTFVATNSVTGVELNVAHVTSVDGVTRNGNAWTRRFVWDAATDVGEVKIDDVTFTVKVNASLGGVQLWENGPYWAECNVGATKPEEYGYYFCWGDTVGYKGIDGTWVGNQYFDVTWVSSNGSQIDNPFGFSSSSCLTYNKSITQLRSEGFIDSANNLVAEHDAATAHLGAPWRMPTDAEFLALVSNCDTTRAMRNGVAGLLVTGRRAYSTRSIFLPAAGCGCSSGGSKSTINLPGSYGEYFSSTSASGWMSDIGAWQLFFALEDCRLDDGVRDLGTPVRPLREKVQSSALTTHLVLDCRSEPSTPVISAESAAFDAASQEVAISCATEGATVYYTIDGSEPSAANGRVYKGPFNIYDSVTVKAIAVKDDWKDSAVASAAFTKNNGLSAAINMYDYLPDNDADAPWTVDAEVSHDGVKSVRSGAIGDDGVTTMKVTVRGAGKLTFWWKSECEVWDEDYYDYGAFRVGSETEPRLRIAGMTDWKREEVVFDTTGKHVCKWEYHKDDAESIPRDCIWVDQVQWMPSDGGGKTLTTEVAVPYDWLDRYGLTADADYEQAAEKGVAKGLKAWESYLLGLDPTNETANVRLAAPTVGDSSRIALGVDSAALEGSGYRAVVELRRRDEAGGAVSYGGIDLAGDDPTGTWSCQISLLPELGGSDAELVARMPGRTKVENASEVGVLKGETAMAKAAVAVPWNGLNGGAVSVAEIVRTTNLAAGDMLHVYDRAERKYRTWQLDGANVWQPLATYVIAEDGSVSSESAGAPSDTTVVRGSAVWLERADPSKPFYLFGGVDDSPVTADIVRGSKESPVWNLIASPSLEPFDVRTVEGADANDQIVVPTADGPRVYTFRDGAWGADVNVTETRTMPDGTKVEVAKRVRDTANTTIPVGVGFWYVSQGGQPVIKW